MFQLRPGRFSRAIPLAAVTLFTIVARGQAIQTRTTAPAPELAFTYDAVRTTTTDTNTLWLQGGALQLHAPFYHGLGLVADAAVFQAMNNASGLSKLDLIIVVFGPRYSFRPKSKRYTFYGQALAGQVNGSHGNFPIGSGPINSSNGVKGTASGLAFQPGGGMDVELTHRFALRLIQADYLRTQLPNGASNVQDNIRLGAGMVVRLGH